MSLTLVFCSVFNFHTNFSHADVLSIVLLKNDTNNMNIRNINLLKRLFYYLFYYSYLEDIDTLLFYNWKSNESHVNLFTCSY